jgi:hypothetical protein
MSVQEKKENWMLGRYTGGIFNTSQLEYLTDWTPDCTSVSYVWAFPGSRHWLNAEDDPIFCSASLLTFHRSLYRLNSPSATVRRVAFPFTCMYRADACTVLCARV